MVCPSDDELTELALGHSGYQEMISVN